jgi:hypothetical protein
MLVLFIFLSAEQLFRVIAAGSKIHEPPKYIKTPRDVSPFKKKIKAVGELASYLRALTQ